MMDQLSLMWQELLARPDGPFAFRFYLQPVMAIFFALRDGRRDAIEGKTPYAVALATDAEHRSSLIRSGWKSIGRVFILAILMDVAYQIVVLKGLRPIEGLIVSIVLAIVPYVLLRGVFERMFHARKKT